MKTIQISPSSSLELVSQPGAKFFSSHFSDPLTQDTVNIYGKHKFRGNASF